MAPIDMSEVTFNPNEVQFVEGQRGSRLLSLGGYNFVRNRATDDKTYWICSRKYSAKCNARVTTEFTRDSPDSSNLHLSVLGISGRHTHEKDPKAVTIIKEEALET